MVRPHMTGHSLWRLFSQIAYAILSNAVSTCVPCLYPVSFLSGHRWPLQRQSAHVCSVCSHSVNPAGGRRPLTEPQKDWTLKMLTFGPPCGALCMLSSHPPVAVVSCSSCAVTYGATAYWDCRLKSRAVSCVAVRTHVCYVGCCPLLPFALPSVCGTVTAHALSLFGNLAGICW